MDVEIECNLESTIVTISVLRSRSLSRFIQRPVLLTPVGSRTFVSIIYHPRPIESSPPSLTHSVQFGDEKRPLISCANGTSNRTLSGDVCIWVRVLIKGCLNYENAKEGKGTWTRPVKFHANATRFLSRQRFVDRSSTLFSPCVESYGRTKRRVRLSSRRGKLEQIYTRREESRELGDRRAGDKNQRYLI